MTPSVGERRHADGRRSRLRIDARHPLFRSADQQHERTPLARLTTAAIEHLEWAKPDNVEALQTRARHEVSQMERGLVVLEIITGIAPLQGLVGTVFGLIEIFGEMTSDQVDTAKFASGISLALYATLSGLSIAIPSLVAWSIYN